MGGGGKQPGAYKTIHTEMHGYILAGTAVASGNMSGDIDPLTTPGGIAGFYEAARSSAIGQSPYAATTPFSPDDSNSRFAEFLEEIDEYVDSIDGSEPSENYNDNFDLLEAQVDAIWGTAQDDDLADEVEAFKAKRLTDFYEELGRQQSDLSLAGASGNTQFAVSGALLNRRYAREVSDYREKLKLENHGFRRKAALTQSLLLSEKQSQYFGVRAQSIAIMSQVTDLWSTALRQKVEDELRLAIEDIFWDGKLYDFLGKALGSISGSSIIPGGTHGENQTLNTISTVAAVGSQAVGTFANIRDRQKANASAQQAQTIQQLDALGGVGHSGASSMAVAR